ncbi:MAG: hypothetical protein LBG66_01685 [Gallionellaceae bacterium]|nr:hypothetical protein [Gallionellaceae bacterium]
MQAQVSAILDEQHKLATSHAQTAKADAREIEQEIRRLVDAIASIGYSDALAARLKEAEGKKRALDAMRPPSSSAGRSEIDDLMARYRRHLLKIKDDLESEPERARSALRDYFGEITIEAADNGEAYASYAESTGWMLLKVANASGYGCGDRI